MIFPLSSSLTNSGSQLLSDPMFFIYNSILSALVFAILLSFFNGSRRF